MDDLGFLSRIRFYTMIGLVIVNTKQAHCQSSIQVDGDIILGGLFPVHVKGEGPWCGERLYNRGIQRLEAMLFAVDQINRNQLLLPNITIGVHILDTCSLDTHALNQSLTFIKASLDVMDTESFFCEDRSSPQLRYHRKPVVGVIGGSYSSVSISVANLFRLFRIPQVSPASTADALSDKSRYEFFARTVPADTFQAAVMVDIIQLFNWSYVSTVASVGSYGQSGIDAFHKEAERRNICIAVQEKVPQDASAVTFDVIVQALLKRPMARGIVLFVRAEDARGILLAAKRQSLQHHQFYWIASDGWGKQEGLLTGVEDVAAGAITVELTSRRLTAFDDYISRLTPATNSRNPWFGQYWSSFFNCTPDVGRERGLFGNITRAFVSGPGAMGANVTASGGWRQRIGKNRCSRDLRLLPQNGFAQESKVQFVVDAVYAFAHALQTLQQNVCPWHEQVCREMRHFDGGEFYSKYLLNVSFTGMSGSEVMFDQRGNGPARYTVFNYQPRETGGPLYKVIGSWIDGNLTMRVEDVHWGAVSSLTTGVDNDEMLPEHAAAAGASSTLPVSVCALPCGVGEVKKMKGSQCCWICDKCEPYEYMQDEYTCRDCGAGRWPYEDRVSCYRLQVQYMSWTSPFAIAPICISVLGILLTIMVIVVFIRHESTPLVKASGRELSYILLAGILICYLNTFLLLARPAALTCALQRVAVGLGFAFIYGALLTKTNRISRIFDSATHSAKRPSFISPRSQIVIAGLLIGVQVVATLLWLLVEPPGHRYFYPSRDEVILKCRINDSSFFVSLVYNMILIVVCTIYAVKARKVPENFNESKFIAFTMYTTCIIWLAFVPIYFGTGNSFEVQITTLCVAISLSASVALVCLYAPKVYIIVLHPEKNVRKLTMSSAAYHRAPNSTAASSSHGLLARETVKMQVSACKAPATTRVTAVVTNSQDTSLSVTSDDASVPTQSSRDLRRTSNCSGVAATTATINDATGQAIVLLGHKTPASPLIGAAVINVTSNPLPNNERAVQTASASCRQAATVHQCARSATMSGARISDCQSDSSSEMDVPSQHVSAKSHSRGGSGHTAPVTQSTGTLVACVESHSIGESKSGSAAQGDTRRLENAATVVVTDASSSHVSPTADVADEDLSMIGQCGDSMHSSLVVSPATDQPPVTTLYCMTKESVI